MNRDPVSPAELRAKVTLTKHEIVHLWNGGILSLKIEAKGVEADIEVRCPEAQQDRGSRGLVIQYIDDLLDDLRSRHVDRDGREGQREDEDDPENVGFVERHEPEQDLSFFYR